MAPESLTRLRVLVVDDEKRLTELLRLELDVEGYDVDVEQDGAGGLIRSRTDPTPDLVIRGGIFLISAGSTFVSACAPGESRSRF